MKKYLKIIVVSALSGLLIGIVMNAFNFYPQYIWIAGGITGAFIGFYLNSQA